MSIFIENNEATSSLLRSIASLSKFSRQATFADATAGTYTVVNTPGLEDLVVFLNGATTLALPTAASSPGRNIIVVNRSATAVSVTPASSLVDIENDPNVGTPSTQSTLFAAASGWVHLMSNGLYWVVVAKPTVTP